MQPRVYIETTIPSFYHETRPQPEMIARRNWTRLWWDHERHKYELVTSAAVRRELGRAIARKGAGLLEMLADVAELALTEDVAAIEREYIRRKVMPADAGGDATHLAAASYYGCHFLLTWNCVHLANANKFAHIRHVNHLLGLMTPVLTTPLELLNLSEPSPS